MCVFRVKGTCFFFLVKSWHAKLALFILIDLVCFDFFFDSFPRLYLLHAELVRLPLVYCMQMLRFLHFKALESLPLSRLCLQIYFF